MCYVLKKKTKFITTLRLLVAKCTKITDQPMTVKTWTMWLHAVPFYRTEANTLPPGHQIWNQSLRSRDKSRSQVRPLIWQVRPFCVAKTVKSLHSHVYARLLTILENDNFYTNLWGGNKKDVQLSA